MNNQVFHKYVMAVCLFFITSFVYAQNEEQRTLETDSLITRIHEQKPDELSANADFGSDSLTTMSLPMLNFSAAGFDGLSPWNYGATPVWQMHQGFNAQLGMAATVGFGKHAPHGVGFSQSAAFGYAMPLSKRFAVAVGLYANNMDWGSFSEREVGVAAAVQYKVNDMVNVYAYGAKSFFPGTGSKHFRYGLPLGMPALSAPGDYYFPGMPSERIGAMAEIKLGKNAMIQVSVEHRQY